jgi:hypothetical protein
MEWVFVMQSVLSMYSICLLQSFTMASFRALPYSSQKLSSAQGWCIFVNMFISCLSIIWLWSYASLCLYVTPFQFEFLSKITWHSFSVWPDSTTAIYGFTMQIIKRVKRREKIIHVQFISQIFKLFSKSSHSCKSCTFPVFDYRHTHVACSISLRIT